MPPRRARTRLLIAATIFGSFLIYLAGNGSISLVDRDEPRYAQCSREMLLGSPEHPGSDWVVPRYLGELRYAKPAGIYWLQAASMNVFGSEGGAGAFAARFPSATAMPITLALVALGIWRWAGPARAAWATLVLATSIMTILAAKACLTDSVLLLWITIAQGCLYLIWRGRAGWGTWAVMGVAMGLAGLIKGPVGLGVMGMTLVALLILRGIDAWLAKRRARNEAKPSAFPVMTTGDAPAQNEANAVTNSAGTNEPTETAISAPKNAIRPTNDPTAARNDPTDFGTPAPRSSAGTLVAQLALALLLMAAVVSPWLYLLNQREPSFLDRSVSHDVVNRIKTGLEGHSGPPGYHLLTIWGTYLPWSVLLPITLVFAWKRRHLAPIRFALAAVLGPWIMFEIVKTKLPHYMLPVFPFMAFLTADAIVRCLRGGHNDLKRRSFIVGISIWAAILGVMALGPLALSIWFKQGIGLASLLVLLGFAYVGIVVWLFARRRPAHGLVAMGVGMSLVIVALLAIFLPRSDPMRLSIRVANVLKREGATDAHEVVMLDYKEPSLAFYQGGTIRENPATALSDLLVDSAPPWMVITKEVWDHPQTSASARDRLEVVESIEGLAYADGGRRVTVMIVRKRLSAAEKKEN